MDRVLHAKTAPNFIKIQFSNRKAKLHVINLYVNILAYTYWESEQVFDNRQQIKK